MHIPRGAATTSEEAPEGLERREPDLIDKLGIRRKVKY